MLAACTQRMDSASRATPSVTSPAPASEPAAPPTAAPAPPSRPVYRRGWAAPAAARQQVRLNGQLHWLQLAAETDSTKRLTAEYEPIPGHKERVRGYEGYFTFALRDAAGQPVFSRQLRKADFFQVAGADIVTESTARLPVLLGYSPLHKALVFTLDFVVPDSDVGTQVVLLLSPSGEVQRLSQGRSAGGGPDCQPAISTDGYAILTATELLRPRLPALPLRKPDADLVGAAFVSDTAFLVVYAPGATHLLEGPGGLESYGRTPTPQQQREANAFVRHTHSGRVLSKFRYDGFYDELGYTIPRHYLPATRTHYLLDARRGLRLLPARTTAVPTELRFANMAAFVPPQTPREVRFELQGDGVAFAFYVDTTSRAPRIRYRKLAQ